MRLLKFIPAVLMIVTAGLAPGQNLSTTDPPPGITIRKYKWAQMGPGPSVDQSWKAESDSASVGGSSEDVPAASVTGRSFFVYSIELLNAGSKEVKAIRWEYLIIDNQSGTELGNHDFETFERIGINKAKLLSAKSRVSPTKVVPIQETDKAVVTETVVLRCVLYQDGSLWRHRDTTAPECEALRRRTAD